MGGILAAVGSSKEAWALYERKFKRLMGVQRVKSDEIKRGKGKCVFTPYSLGNRQGALPHFHLTKLIKKGT